jgi:hypothetical protein
MTNTAITPFLFESEHLIRLVMREDEPWIAVANRHRQLEAHFAGTSWAAGWNACLGDLPGALRYPGIMKFHGYASRATMLPPDLLLGAAIAATVRD